MVALADCCALPELLALPRPAEWQALRARAEGCLEGQDYPTPKQEDWKYTDLAPLKALHPVPGAPVGVDIKPHILPEARGTRMVFVNGHYDDHHSNTSALPPGVRLLRLSQATEAAALLGTLTPPESGDIFSNLNTARFQDGALVYVPRNVRVEAVLHILFLSVQGGEVPTCALPRLLVVLEPGSELTLVEEHAGRGTYVTNAVVEVHVKEGARFNHERVQRESPTAIHFARVAARVQRGARYATRTLSFGARLSRHTPSVDLAAEGAELELLSLAMLEGHQVADTHSRIDHRVPQGSTRQLHKAVVDGSARAIFNGKIMVHPGAQQTDAQQQCRTLLLSDEARVDAKPELEIFADDVKCAHGAAVGQLDPEEVFYLTSRGLDPHTARNVLTYGFASQVIASITVPSLQRTLRQAVMERTQK